MLALIVNGENVELEDTQITLNIKSPIFNDLGSYSYPFRIPNTIKNRSILKFRHRVASTNDKYEIFPCIITWKGNIVADGRLEVKVGDSSVYEATFFADTGDFYYWIKDRQLNTLNLGEKTFSTEQDAIDYFNGCKGKYFPDRDFNFPMIYNDKFLDPPTSIPDLLYYNYYYYNSLITDKYELHLNLDGGGRTILIPFLFFKTVLRNIFKGLGYILNDEVFTHSDFNKLVFYNSTDANNRMSNYNYTITHLFYNMHVPNIKILDLLKSIEIFWNARFFIDRNSKTVNLIPVDKIIRRKDYIDIHKNLLSISIDLDDEYTGITLTHEADSDDDYYSDWLKTLNNNDQLYPFQGTVKSLSQLPSYPVGLPGWIYFVKDEGRYYYMSDVTKTWIEFPNVNWRGKSDGFLFRSGDNSISTSLSTLSTDYDGIVQCRNKFAKYRDVASRIFFMDFKSMAHGTAPAGKQSVGIHSLLTYALDNQTNDIGLYTTNYKAFLNWQSKSSAVTIMKQMDYMELKELDFSRKYLMNGMAYLISEIQVTLTSQGIKPAKLKCYTAI